LRSPCKVLTAARTPQGWFVARLHYSANPLLDPDTEDGKRRIAQLRNDYVSKAKWDMEMEIDAHALEGQRVYPEFTRDLHVLPHEQVVYADVEKRIKRQGCCFMALDPHPRTPHAALWVLIDGWNDWYVYRDFWDSVVYGIPKNVKDDDSENLWTVKDYAAAIAALEGNKIEWHHAETAREYGIYRHMPGGEKIRERRCDQAGKGFFEKGSKSSIWQSYNNYGLHFLEPYKNHRVGEDEIRQLLKPRRHHSFGEWPRLHISDRCEELILEMTRYKYKQTKRFVEDKELAQEGVQARCHLIDTLRYLATADLRFSPKGQGVICGD